MKNYNDVLRRYIYHLIDPKTGAVFYVGQSTDPGERLKKHVETMSGKIADIVNGGQYPVMKIIASIDGTYTDAVALEQAEIKKFPKEQLQNKWRATL